MKIEQKKLIAIAHPLPILFQKRSPIRCQCLKKAIALHPLPMSEKKRSPPSAANV